MRWISYLLVDVDFPVLLEFFIFVQKNTKSYDMIYNYSGLDSENFLEVVG